MSTTQQCTLTRLDEASGGAFGESVVLISSVSGGSVGAMYYVDRYRGAETEHDSIRREASRSSLYGTAWGLVYGDFWRWIPLLGWRDRGLALERIWRERLSDPEASLWDWWADTTAWRPFQIHNATIAETGERILIGAVDSVAEARTFARLYPDADVSVATAARLSATFPYVSPIARPQFAAETPDSVAYHLADGGYFDNHGVATAIDFVDKVLTADSIATRVLFVQIRSAAGDPDDADVGNGWKYAIAGPLITLVNMRTAAQIDRNASQLQQFRAKWRWAERSVDIVPVAFVLEDTLSLSWHLSKSEITKFPEAWASDENEEGCKKILGHFYTRADAGQRCEGDSEDAIAAELPGETKDVPFRKTP